jgi:hypothetical protein
MAYICPKCGEKVKRGRNPRAPAFGGVVGLMVSTAFGPMVCPRCGTIPKKDFPAADQQRMTRDSAILLVGAVGVVAAAIILIIVLNR